MTKEYEAAHSKNTLLSIDDDAVLAESLEYQSKVSVGFLLAMRRSSTYA